MKVCLPIESDRGPDSLPYAHFGSAPYFLLYDTETGQTRTIGNADEHHVHGACQPLDALAGERVEAIIVGGIGSRAIARLNGQGIKVYRSLPGSARENIERLQKNELPELTPDQACGGHGHPCGH
jgi:predicted Fe-Mo cluster-binding NifX family protein